MAEHSVRELSLVFVYTTTLFKILLKKLYPNS